MCGIFGIHAHPEAANMVYLGLYALQHRGQESAGIAVAEGGRLCYRRQMGLVAEAFDERLLRELNGGSAIGHVRYSTTGGTELRNAQPFVVEGSRGALALAHNGNLVNARQLREELERRGSIFQSTMDTEVIVHLMAIAPEESLLDRLRWALRRIQGAYSLLLLTSRGRIIAARDPWGFRPLVLGKLKGSYVVTSETCALDLIEAEYLREVEPGEVLVIDQEGMRSLRTFEPRPQRCIFELIYFARPDSLVFGHNVYEVRKRFGQHLAREHPLRADVVVPVPDSGVPAAIGFAQEAGIPFETALVRNHYVGRTFIEPQQSIRHFGVKVKLNPLRGFLEGKRVVLVDDSLVRGTTLHKIVKMIRAAGAREVHLRIASPPIRWPCFYGIDTPTRAELIASSHSLEETCRYLTADGLEYLSLEGLRTASGGEGFCEACFTGRYPVEPPGGEVQ